jgi:hypothetical protein
VVLLCVDGADLGVLLPLAEAGELPTFTALMRDGVWGELATLRPTLSPVVWTTLATGMPPEVHGIRHFTHVRLPGLERPILQFPLHSGLNFHLLPLLERLPGVPQLEVPNTSNLRRVGALWNLVGRRYPVGVWRWLVTWPAEPVPGFAVAGGIGWAQFVTGLPRDSLAEGAVYPPGLLEGRPAARALPVTDADLARYGGEGWAADSRAGEDGPRRALVVSSLRDPTARVLPELIAETGARFTAAAFYSVDPYHHLFGRLRGGGGRFSGAVDEAYRLTDRRLGELLAALGPGVRVIVVSDHGFDFAQNHHTWAPPGVLFARGPGFAAGRRVEGLSVYDVAPLVLRLLDLPLAEDMPGTRRGAWRRLLTPGFRASHPTRRIASYGTAGAAGDERSLASPRDEEIKRVLRSLGYIR